MKIEKAVIATGGFGTRLLPATKSIPKALMPVVDKSLLQWAVEETIAAGFTQIAVLHRPDQLAIPPALKTSEALSNQLLALGKEALLEDLRQIDHRATYHWFPISNETSGLGCQLLCMEDFLNQEPFAVVFVDEMCDPTGGLLTKLREVVEAYDTSASAMIHAQGDEEVMLVGPVTKRDGHHPLQREGGQEHDQRPRFIGRGVFTGEILKAFLTLANGTTASVDLMDGMAVLAEHQRLLALRHDGGWWDCGDKLGYLEAVVVHAARDPNLGPRFMRFVNEFSAREGTV